MKMIYPSEKLKLTARVSLLGSKNNENHIEWNKLLPNL